MNKLNNLVYTYILLLLLVGCGGGGGGDKQGSDQTTKTLASIFLSPANPIIAPGKTTQFTATGKYSDGSSSNITASVNWNSSNLSVAVVSNATASVGKATSLAEGKATITAVSGGISASTILTVTNDLGAVNVMSVSINGSLCSADYSYPNKPCVSVTVCTPGTGTCQTINDVILDTGSSGLRIFKQALPLSLPPVSLASGSLAECVQFGDGSSLWGPVVMADVVMGNEPSVQIPIQVIDFNYGVRPALCTNAGQKPADVSYTGILGLGPFVQDCGSTCENSSDNGLYYSCGGSSCPGTKVNLTSQVQNPAASLSQDNNGVLFDLPIVPLGGLQSVEGRIVFGIETRLNNVPGAVTTYATDDHGEFTTVFNGTTYGMSFIDSGSNGLFFSAPAALLPSCASPYSEWFCPTATTDLYAVNYGAAGSPSGEVPFKIGNFISLYKPNQVFSEIGGNLSGGYLQHSFDWGLPFFMGRTVFLGFEGRSSLSLGAGPYWAY